MGSEKKLTSTFHGYKVYEEPPSQEELNEYYQKNYYQNRQNTSTYQVTYSSNERIQRNLRIQLLSDFIEFNWIKKSKNVTLPQSSTGRFLDVGCGEGYVLKHFNNLGWEIKGLDFSTHGLQVNNPELEPFIIQGDVYKVLKELKEGGSKFDVIFLGNILEHVLDAIILLDLLNGLLDDDALLVITVPNDYSDLQEYLIKNNYVSDEYWLTYPDHLNYFNFENISKLLSNLKLPVIDHYCDFPIEWFLLNSHSNYASDKSKGKEAHNARVVLDSLINVSKNKEAKMNFWRSLGALGMGRTITTISRKVDH